MSSVTPVSTTTAIALPSVTFLPNLNLTASCLSTVCQLSIATQGLSVSGFSCTLHSTLDGELVTAHGACGSLLLGDFDSSLSVLSLNSSTAVASVFFSTLYLLQCLIRLHCKSPLLGSVLPYPALALCRRLPGCRCLEFLVVPSTVGTHFTAAPTMPPLDCSGVQDCSSNGVCVSDNTCACYAHYYGPNCLPFEVVVGALPSSVVINNVVFVKINGDNFNSSSTYQCVFGSIASSPATYLSATQLVCPAPQVAVPQEVDLAVLSDGVPVINLQGAVLFQFISNLYSH